MKKLLIISFLSLFLGLNTARAEEKTVEQKQESKRVESSQIDSGKSNPNLMMKIPSDDQDDEVRRKEFIEELRKLYKANFL